MYCINEMSLEILLSMSRILSLESWKLGKKKRWSDIASVFQHEFLFAEDLLLSVFHISLKKKKKRIKEKRHIVAPFLISRVGSSLSSSHSETMYV